MIMDVVKILEEDFSRETFTVEFVDCFDDLKGTDANFEMIASNTIQPLRLPYKGNIAKKRTACIFVHTKSKDLNYEQALERKD